MPWIQESVFVMRSDIDLKYKPGALWKARKVIYGYNKNGDLELVDYGDIVLLVNYDKNHFEEMALVLTSNGALVMFVGIDFGYSFNMSPIEYRMA